jgi:hypothetical protein
MVAVVVLGLHLSAVPARAVHMSDYHVPKGVSLSTLQDIVVGWAAVGAAAEPRYTTAVEDVTGIADAVGRQTRFLEAIGVLERVGQQHRLTDDGQSLAGGLMAEDSSVAAERAQAVLSAWGLTDEVRGVLRENPMAADDLVPVVAALAGQDRDDDRTRSGITTLLDLFEWSGVLVRDGDRYRLPASIASPSDPDLAADREREFETRPAQPLDADERAVIEHDGAETDGGPAAANGADDTESSSDGDTTSSQDAAGSSQDAAGQEAGTCGSGSEQTADGRDGSVAAASVGDAATDLETVAEAVRRIDSDTEPGDHALSVGIDVDADPDELEALVAAIRRGLVADENR